MHPRYLRSARAALALCAVLSASPVHAAWPTNPGTPFYFDNPIGNVSTPFACSDGAGGVYVAWPGISIDQMLHAQHVLANGSNAPGWPAAGIVICNTPSAKYMTQMLADGHGGFFVVWTEDRGGGPKVYVQHIGPTGAAITGWPAAGQIFSSGIQPDRNGHMILDGAGGVFLVWEYDFTPNVDVDIYCARISVGDTIAFQHSLDANLSIQDWPRLCSDGAGGFYVAYENNLSGSYNITVAHVSSGGVVVAGPADIATNPSNQERPDIAPDAIGGAIVAWQDDAPGFGQDDVYAEHFDSNLTALWAGGAGLAIRVASGYQNNPIVVTDRAGGAFICWNDAGGERVVRVYPSGAFASGWPVGGYALGSGFGQSCVEDGTGGVIVAWRNGSLYATRLDAYGSLAPGWQYGGTLAYASPYDESTIIAVPDGSGGALLVWDQYSISSPNLLLLSIEGAKLDRYGALGDATPHMAGVKDVPADQGGHVRVAWNASYLDADPDFLITDYRIWQQVPAALAASALRGSRVHTMSEEALRVGDMAEANGFYWQYAGSVPAAGYPSYGFLASTTGDSTGTGNPKSVFKVQARLSWNPLATWDSAPDSGYSVDNLPPVAPTPFSATYIAGNGTFTSWGPNAEPDLAGYRLYRGGGLNFTPSPVNRIYDGTLASYHDAATTPYIYKVCAYDVHGNEGPCTTAQPPGTTAADAAVPRELTLSEPAPNPARGEAVLRLGVPRAERVELAIYDAAGRRVKTLWSGEAGAGWLETRWDGRDASGARARSGLYFARLEAEGRRLRQRIVLLE